MARFRALSDADATALLVGRPHPAHERCCRVCRRPGHDIRNCPSRADRPPLPPAPAPKGPTHAVRSAQNARYGERVGPFVGLDSGRRCRLCGGQGHNSRSCPVQSGRRHEVTGNVVLLTQEHGAIRVPVNANGSTAGPLFDALAVLDGALSVLGRRLDDAQRRGLDRDRLDLLRLHHTQAVAACRFFRSLDFEARAWLGAGVPV